MADTQPEVAKPLEGDEKMAAMAREQAEQVILDEDAARAAAEEASKGAKVDNPFEGDEVTDEEFDTMFDGAGLS